MRFDLNLAFICTCSKPKLVSSNFVVKKLVKELYRVSTRCLIVTILYLKLL